MRNLRKMDIKQVLLVFFVALTTGIVVLGTPSESQAQVTISNVTVTIGATSYSLWASQAISAGQSLVLAQNPPANPNPAFNFDSSDSNGYTGGTAVVSGTGFSFTDKTHVLTVANADPTGFAFNEAQNYTPIGSFTSNGLLITVSVGYADNSHSDACGSGATANGLSGSSTCFPSNGPWPGTATLPTFFQGSGQFAPKGYPGMTTPHAPCDVADTSSTCYDSGVILFTATPAAAPPPIAKGDTATIGFWHNKNGQGVINCLNGGPNSTSLATYLAMTYPNLFGASSLSPWIDMTGQTNAQVAADFLTFFGMGGMKTEAQALGAALAAYVTNTSQNTTGCGGQFGFNISGGGSGGHTITISQADATALGLTKGTGPYTVNELLAGANAHPTAFNAINDVFDAVNSQGDIGG